MFRDAGEEIEVLVHPQSVVHSMVAYVDGSVLAQLGDAGHAHADRPHPGLAGSDGAPSARLDLAEIAQLDLRGPAGSRAVSRAAAGPRCCRPAAARRPS